MNGDLIHYEDLEVGIELRFGAYAVTREEVIAFAEKFDPQPFHLDDAAAAATHFGRLAASGWHIGAMTMRIVCDGFVSKSAGLGGGGVEHIKWLRPVHPGDTLSCVLRVTEKRRSKSRPEMGIYLQQLDTLNQYGEVVQSTAGMGMIAVRHPEAPL